MAMNIVNVLLDVEPVAQRATQYIFDPADCRGHFGQGVRDVLFVERCAVGHHCGLKKRVVELSDIAGPIVFFHKYHCGIRNLFVLVGRPFTVQLFVDLAQESRNNLGDVALAIAQRRELDRDRGQTVN